MGKPQFMLFHKLRYTLLAVPGRLRRRFLHTAAVLVLLGPLFQSVGKAGTGQARPALAEFELHPSLEVSLFVSEPNIVDPVAMTFDEDGRIFVVEMRDYPLGIGPEHRPGGTIRLLEDTNGDGRIDRSTIFAENLSFPTSLAPWKGGVLVTAAPEILYLKDTDGDRKADVREVVLGGFTLGVTDSNVNGLRWGLDNRVHGVNGGNGGNISSPRKPGAAIPLREFDFSFDPGTGDFTTTFQTSGGFGLVFDAWGRSFATYNINHIQHRVLPIRYQQRFPGFPPVETTVSISDHEEMSRIYPISRPETRVNHPEQAGHFSAAGGMGLIGDPRYSGDLPGSILVCDVVGNLVHRDVLVENGPSFIAKRSPDETTKEFFASRDNACRPVGVELGPDGALYVIDMQRAVIEHPDYIPQKVKETLDLRAGEFRGRIYRVTPKRGLASRKPNLSRASTAKLISELTDPNAWWRRTAQRLLVERQDPRAIPGLKKLTGGSNPLGRLHALWTLQGLHALDETLVLRGLADSNAGVRENSLQLAEPFLPGSSALRRKILSMASDPEARVRFQAALTLGQLDVPEVNAALRDILLRDCEFRWSRLAVLSSLRINAEALFASLLGDSGFRGPVTEAKIELTTELAGLIGARLKPADASVVTAVLTAPIRFQADPRFQKATLEGLRAGLERSGVSVVSQPDLARALEQLSASASPALMAEAWRLSRKLGLPENAAQRRALADAMKAARDSARSETVRLENIRLLALGEFGTVAPTLFSLLEGTETSAVQTEAVAVLKQFGDVVVARTLVRRWRSLAPTVRPAVVNLWLQRRSFHEFLVAAMEADQIKSGELNLDLEQRRRLLRESSPEISARAAKLLGDEEYSNRKTVVADWLKKLPASGDPQRGQAIFEKTCAQCHASGSLGSHVGPDLSDVAHRSVEDLLSNILDPNMAINPSYVSYNAELESGELESGILQSESAEAITLLQAQGKKVVVPRQNLKRLESSGLSLMPEGLEAGLTPENLRDLIAFLQKRN